MSATCCARLLTDTGFGWSDATPIPSSDEPFEPQHFAEAPLIRAQVCDEPAERATASARPLTGTGLEREVNVPSPNCPRKLWPQHRAVPSPSNAQEWLSPAVTA